MTFRSIAITAAAGTAAFILAGCGSTTDRSVPAPAQTVSVSPVVAGTTQPLADWLTSSTSVLNRLTTDLSNVTDSLSSGTALDGGPLQTDAKAGLDLAAPAGHPALDRAWDAVMDDYLLVSGDLTANDPAQASADLNATSADMQTLQRESAGL